MKNAMWPLTPEITGYRCNLLKKLQDSLASYSRNTKISSHFTPKITGQPLHLTPGIT
jgi:hypothetical protein